MAVALLTTLLIFHGGGGFAVQLFGEGNQALVSEVVSDPERAAAAVQIMKQGQKDLDGVAKQFETIAKAFTATDETQSAGLDQLLPLLQQASEQRRVVQAMSLERVFELRKTLTEEEWSAFFANVK